MGWLAALLATFAEKLLTLIGEDALAWYQKRQATAAAQKAALAAANASVQGLKDAKTGADVDNATPGALDGT